MGWAADHGLPHSALLGWDPVDRSKLVAYLLEKAERCSMCGTAEWEWDPKQGGSKHAYTPEVHVCLGCYNRSIVEKDETIPPGAQVRLVPASRVRVAGRRRRRAA